MRVETIETIIVCIIVSIQLGVFIRTLIQILKYRRIFPKISSFQISTLLVPISDLERLSPQEILIDIHHYENARVKFYKNPVSPENFGSAVTPSLFDSNYEESNESKDEVNIVETTEKTNHILDNILYSINNYLIRNRGAASDFNLIRDTVERNTNAIEEDINLSIAVPLYLGLMGTMLGIVIGLFNMPDIGLAVDSKEKDILLNDGISFLIGGVKIAMIASFTGLFLTILNSGWIFKSSRNLAESRKNEFYTFIQIELLPIINQGLASTLESLQRNLLKFNKEFTINLRQLSGIFDSSAKAVKAQKELLDTIDKTKVAEMTRYNIRVLQQLDLSVGQFQKFNAYLTNINLFSENSQHLVNRTNELLTRTDNFRVIAENLDNKLDLSQKLLEFLSTHFSKLEDHREFTSNAVADVGHAISATFKELQEHIQKSSEVVKQFTVDEIEALKKALSESKTNLSNLEYLATLNKDVSQFKNNSTEQGENIKQKLNDLNNNILKSIVILGKIENGSLTSKAKGIIKSTKNLFRSKNNAL